MGQIKKMMELSFFILLFCIAISYLFLGNESITRLQKEIYQMLNNEVAIEMYKDQEELFVTKADIIAFLMTSKIDYDVEINGFTIKKSNHSPLSINESAIADGKYTKDYFYDNLGKVTKVIYKKVG